VTGARAAAGDMADDMAGEGVMSGGDLLAK